LEELKKVRDSNKVRAEYVDHRTEAHRKWEARKEEMHNKEIAWKTRRAELHIYSIE